MTVVVVRTANTIIKTSIEAEPVIKTVPAPKPVIKIISINKPVIKITQSPKVVVKTTASRGLPGPQGPEGPPGAAGSAPQAYTHVQAVPSSEWIVVHNLGYRPGGVHVVNSAGDEVIGDIRHDSINQFAVIVASPFSGIVYAS
jgi:hypothetical protein